MTTEWMDPAVSALAPVTVPQDPERERRLLLLPSQRTAGVIVNEDTGLTQSAVWACIRVISESLAGMPWTVGRLTEDGTIERLADHMLNWTLNFAPNNETEAFTFRETLWAWALGWGNGYAEIERDLRGEPVALWQIHPSRVQPFRMDPTNVETVRSRLTDPSAFVYLQPGQLWYRVDNDESYPTYEVSYLPARNMFHLRGPSPDGLVGWSVIRMHARTIGLALAQEDNAATFNANDSTPGGVLEHPGKLSPEAQKHLIESWQRRHGGPSNKRKVAVLEEGMKWAQTGIDPNDSKLVEQMQLTPSMICRIFRVPPHKIADLSRSTNNNIEHQDLEFVKDTLRPWAERGEGEANLKLFGRNNQARLVTVIDMSERERGDTNSQTQHVKEMLFCGVYDIDEARRYLGLRPIGKAAGGNKRFVQSAMVLLNDVGELPHQPAQSQQDASESMEDDEDSEEEDELAEVQGAAMLVLQDALERIGKREEANAHLTGDRRADWKIKHGVYCRDALSPATAVLSAALKVPAEAASLALSVFVEAHLKSDERWQVSDKAVSFRECLLAAAKAKEVP